MSQTTMGSTAFFFLPPSVPLMPSSTPTSERFMAAHMMTESSAPEAPMSAPTTVRSCEESTKPSAQSAQPL